MARRTRLLMSTVAAVGVATLAGAGILLAAAEPGGVQLVANQLVNPCAAKNPCAAVKPCNPCAAVRPCAAVNPCAAASPCAANPCAANPCAPKKAN